MWCSFIQTCRAKGRSGGCRPFFTPSATSSRTRPPTPTPTTSCPTAPTSRRHRTPYSSRAGESTSTSWSRSTGTLARAAVPTPSMTSAVSRRLAVDAAGAYDFLFYTKLESYFFIFPLYHLRILYVLFESYLYLSRILCHTLAPLSCAHAPGSRTLSSPSTTHLRFLRCL